MKALTIIMLPALMLIGCGQIESNKQQAHEMLGGMEANGSLDGSELRIHDESLLAESVELTETGSNSIMMKLGDAELLIDFMENLSGEPDQTAMIINGIEVATQVIQNPDSFQALIASLVTSQLEGVDILGVPANQLVQVGMNLINRDRGAADFSNLFGTLVRGAFNMFLSDTPYRSLFEQIADGIIDQVSPGQSGQSQQGSQETPASNNQQNNNSSGILGTVVNTVGNLVSGSSPLLGGIFSLITNLIK